MINVLINAYAVSPSWGSEPGLGWNWVVNMSKYCNVFVITEGEWREDIEKAVNQLPQRNNIHFYYNPLSPEIRRMCWNQGDWRFYKYYRQWQNRTLGIAKEIIRYNSIDVIHQLNMIGFREPGSLWQIKDIPFVWGPVGGYGWTTLKYLNGQPLRLKVKAIIKNLINYLQGRFYPLSNRAIKRADCVLAANSKVHDFIKKNHRKDVILMNETGCYEKDISLNDKDCNTDSFNLLWVGKLDYRKQLELAIRTVSILRETYSQIILNIVGDTNNAEYKRLSKLARLLKIENNIVWYGKIPNTDVHRMMQKSDLFLFTSIAEGTPHVVLEAIQNNLPVICFDTCGQGDVVNEEVGIKVPLTDSKQSPFDFAKEISSVIKDVTKLKEMRHNCAKRQKELSWDLKVRKMIEIFNTVIKK